ncbi:MAG: transcription antitermination factor NusB [Clostridia bacterium]|nr:transcription antitermination factor NusB [Clostridia bacterium]
MQKLNRHQERREVLFLLFETLFKEDESPELIYSLSKDERQLPESNYIKDTYFGVTSNVKAIDDHINAHAKGRSASQMSAVTRSILRLAVYEILYADGLEPRIAINEAVELSKEFEDIKVKGFINGILNAIYKDSLENSEEKNDG